MAVPRGKRIALLVGTVVVLGVAVAVLASWDRLREEWYIRQLSSTDKATQDRAAAKLGEMKSVRAVPELMLRLRRSMRYIELASSRPGKEAASTNAMAVALWRIDPDSYALLKKEAEKSLLNLEKHFEQHRPRG